MSDADKIEAPVVLSADNPFRPAATAPAPAAPPVVAPEPEVEPVAVAPKPADKPVHSLDDIEDAAVLRKMVRDTRREAAKARTDKNAELAEFEAWKDAQKTEAERAVAKATSRAEAAEKRANALVAKTLLLEYNVPDDLAEFVTGTEDEMRAKAEKLRGALPVTVLEMPIATDKPVVGLLAGPRGDSLGGRAQTSGDWFRERWDSATKQ